MILSMLNDVVTMYPPRSDNVSLNVFGMSLSKFTPNLLDLCNPYDPYVIIQATIVNVIIVLRQLSGTPVNSKHKYKASIPIKPTVAHIFIHILSTP